MEFHRKKYGAHSHVHLLFSNFFTIIHSRGQRYVVPLTSSQTNIRVKVRDVTDFATYSMFVLSMIVKY